MSMQKLTSRLNRLEQAIPDPRKHKTPLTFLVLPYKDHWPDEDPCQCENPRLVDRGTFYAISYHPRPGIEEEINALIQRVKEGYQ